MTHPSDSSQPHSGPPLEGKESACPTTPRGDALPQANGEVTEDAQGITDVGEAPEFASGTTADLSLTLDAGSYVIVCNIAGHYGAGIRVAFTVT